MFNRTTIYQVLMSGGMLVGAWLIIQSANVSPAGLVLETPDTLPATFLDDEAGISIYISTTQPINLNSNLLRNQFRILEAISTTYLIGSVPVPGYGPTEDVKAFVHQQGWIVIYYRRNDPTSRVFDYESGIGSTITTRLDKVLTNVAGSINETNYTPRYYHWRYPMANQILLIGEGRGGRGTDSFKVQLPDTFTYYEQSWYLKSSGEPDPSFILDGSTIATTHDASPAAGYLSIEQLTPSVEHSVGVYNDRDYWGDVFGGLAIVYREP